jgi:hypothetical protein
MISQGPDSAVNGGRVPGGRLKHSGIMVLASDGRVLYVNKAGRDLLLRLDGKENDSALGALPKPLTALIDEIQASREVTIEDRGWRRFALERLIEAQGRSLFVQAFAQPQRPDTGRPIIVLTMHSSDAA